ncbi:MAG: hypothetical protein Ct9H300mP19_02500 [Dehalococcoidia bacterium]|nr:MAG: hypothetical protein Ct9H300mP19_02500 [Dehalococcoidia bacterium]
MGTTRLAIRSDRDGRFWHKFTASLFGLILLAIALAGPLDYYSGDLFAAHMSQHIVIAMFAAPLLLLARPMPAYIWALPRPFRVGVGTALDRLRSDHQGHEDTYKAYGCVTSLHRHVIRMAYTRSLQPISER